MRILVTEQVGAKMECQEIIRTENVLIRTMELAPNASTDWHYHTEVTDFFVCLHGIVKVESKIPDQVVILQPGQRTAINPRQFHRVVNIHHDKSEYLLVQGVGRYDFIKE